MAAPRLVEQALKNQSIRSWFSGRPVTVVAAGKAAAPMAITFSDLFEGELIRGIVVGPHGSEQLPKQLEWQGAGHPLPNSQSLSAGKKALKLAREISTDSQMVVLLSGGASSLLSVPVEGLNFNEKVTATQVMLSAGVEINKLNCVRKHLSSIKGGRLAAVARCPVMTLAISDVVGPIEDDPTVIGSGLTVADPSTFEQALHIVEMADLNQEFPKAARRVLERGIRSDLPETPKPGDPRLDRSTLHVIGSRQQAMDGAKRTAASLGYRVATFERPVVGEAQVAGRNHLARLIETVHELGRRPVCLLSSGETTVKVVGKGRGGRNQELALATVRNIGRLGERAVLASFGTDGVDGPTDAAGAIVDSRTFERAFERNIGDPESYLIENNSYAYFELLGDLLKIGPTNTNVGDVQIALVSD